MSNHLGDWVVLFLHTDGEREFVKISQVKNFNPKDALDFDKNQSYVVRTDKWFGNKPTNCRGYILGIGETKLAVETQLNSGLRPRHPHLVERDSDVETATDIDRERDQPPRKKSKKELYTAKSPDTDKSSQDFINKKSSKSWKSSGQSNSQKNSKEEKTFSNKGDLNSLQKHTKRTHVYHKTKSQKSSTITSKECLPKDPRNPCLSTEVHEPNNFANNSVANPNLYKLKSTVKTNQNNIVDGISFNIGQEILDQLKSLNTRVQSLEEGLRKSNYRDKNVEYWLRYQCNQADDDFLF